MLRECLQKDSKDNMTMLIAEVLVIIVDRCGLILVLCRNGLRVDKIILMSDSARIQEEGKREGF